MRPSRRSPWSKPMPSLALVACLGALAGCGPSGGGGRPAAHLRKLEPCALLTRADAQAALGGPVGQIESTSVLDDARNSSGDPSQCGYGLEEDASHTIRLEVRPMASAERARGVLDSTRSVLRATGVTDVPGLGDAAFWAGAAVRQLHVRQGSVEIVISCDPGEGKDALATARGAAAKVLARLKDAERAAARG